MKNLFNIIICSLIVFVSFGQAMEHNDRSHEVFDHPYYHEISVDEAKTLLREKAIGNVLFCGRKCKVIDRFTAEQFTVCYIVPSQGNNEIRTNEMEYCTNPDEIIGPWGSDITLYGSVQSLQKWLSEFLDFTPNPLINYALHMKWRVGDVHEKIKQDHENKLSITVSQHDIIFRFIWKTLHPFAMTKDPGNESWKHRNGLWLGNVGKYDEHSFVCEINGAGYPGAYYRSRKILINNYGHMIPFDNAGKLDDNLHELIYELCKDCIAKW